MAGTARQLIDRLIHERGKGDRVAENTIRVKLILKGIPVDSLTASTQDDTGVIERIKHVAKDFGVAL